MWFLAIDFIKVWLPPGLANEAALLENGPKSEVA